MVADLELKKMLFTGGVKLGPFIFRPLAPKSFKPSLHLGHVAAANSMGERKGGISSWYRFFFGKVLIYRIRKTRKRRFLNIRKRQLASQFHAIFT
ncbi:MAG: hypothetical protein CFE28_16155 [Alphaproteobacteria bacterium PA2]|nr:MAG: hypothetical protein CFE28_16155 [Alphaproteobacteria bacterium PA2]